MLKPACLRTDAIDVGILRIAVYVSHYVYVSVTVTGQREM